MIRKTIPWITLGLLAFGVASADAYLTKNADKAVPSRAQQEQGSVFGSLLGQFRGVAASWLWIKADVYHHEFVEQNDRWTQNTDILPIMRMITYLDPHFVQAYASGAWMLALYHDRPGQARTFLAEGLRYNPDSSELNQTMAIISWRYDGNAEAALHYLKKARDVATNSHERQSLARTVESIEYQLAHGLENPSLGSLNPERRRKEGTFPEHPENLYGPPGEDWSGSDGHTHHEGCGHDH